MFSETEILDAISNIPGTMHSLTIGSKIVYKYIKNSYQNDPFRTVLEVSLVVFLFWYFSKSKSEDSSKIKLSEEEIQELIDEWEPEPLVGALTEDQKFELDRIPVVHGPVGLKVKLADVRQVNIT